jgi:ribosomal protein S18 acetylase RimI-like enzyme
MKRSRFYFQNMIINIRDASPSDCIAIAALHAANWRQYYRGIYSDYFLDNEVEQERLAVWQQRFSAPTANQQVIVATAGDVVLGFACLFLDEDPFWGSLLDNLHVSGLAQRSGIGKRLLQECAARILMGAKSTKLYLWVYQANEAARRVYEHLGASHVATEEQVTKDGVRAMACRYAWKDVTPLATLKMV